MDNRFTEPKIGLVLTRGALCIYVLGDCYDWTERAVAANLLWIWRPLKADLRLRSLLIRSEAHSQLPLSMSA